SGSDIRIALEGWKHFERSAIGQGPAANEVDAVGSELGGELDRPAAGQRIERFQGDAQDDLANGCTTQIGAQRHGWEVGVEGNSLSLAFKLEDLPQIVDYLVKGGEVVGVAVG